MAVIPEEVRPEVRSLLDAGYWAALRCKRPGREQGDVVFAVFDDRVHDLTPAAFAALVDKGRAILAADKELRAASERQGTTVDERMLARLGYFEGVSALFADTGFIDGPTSN